MSRKTTALNRMWILAWLLLASGMAAQAQDRPRIMPSPNPDVVPTHGDRRFDEPAVSDLITRFLSDGHQDDGLQ